MNEQFWTTVEMNTAHRAEYLASAIRNLGISVTVEVPTENWFIYRPEQYRVLRFAGRSARVSFTTCGLFIFDTGAMPCKTIKTALHRLGL